MPTLTADRERQLEDSANRGEALYERELRESLEREHMAEIVAIHPDSGDYALGRYRTEAFRALRRKQPKGLMFLTRIGPPTSSDFSVVERMESASEVIEGGTIFAEAI